MRDVRWGVGRTGLLSLPTARPSVAALPHVLPGGGNTRMAVEQVAKCTLAGSGSLVSGKSCHFPGLRFLPCKTRVLITTVPIAERCFGGEINELLHPSAGS